MMLIELALLCLTRAAFFKRLALLDTQGRHSAIYLLIAGTYTPFLAQMKNVLASAGLGSRSRYEIRRGKGSMSIVGDIGLALGVLLFAFGMVGLVTRI